MIQRFSAHRATWSFLVLLLAFVPMGCGGGSDSVSGKPVDMSDVEQRDLSVSNPIASNGLDVSMVSDQLFMAGVVVHPQQIFASGVIAPEELEALVSDLTARTGLPLETCSRALVLIRIPDETESSGMPLMIFEFGEPLDFAERIQEIGGPLESKSVGDHTVFFDSDSKVAGYQRAPNQIVLGAQDLIDRFANNRLPRTGRLAELLGDLDLDADVEGAVNGSSLGSMMGGGNGDEMPDKMVFSLSLTDESMATLNFTAPDAEKAKEFKSQTEQSISVFKLSAPMLLRSITKDLSNAESDVIKDFVRDLLAGTAVEVEGAEVSIRIAQPSNLPQVVAIVGAMAEKEQRVQQRVSRYQRVADAMLNYHEQEQEYPPIGDLDEETSRGALSWRVHLLPYLGYEDLYEQFELDEAWDSPHNLALLDQMPEEFMTCDAANETTIGVLSGPDAPFNLEYPTTHATIADGRTKTFMILDRGELNSIPWTKPDEWAYEAEGPLVILGNEDEPFFLAALFDQTVHRVPRSTSESDLRALITHSGQEDFDVEAALGIMTFDPNNAPGGFPFGN